MCTLLNLEMIALEGALLMGLLHGQFAGLHEAHFFSVTGSMCRSNLLGSRIGNLWTLFKRSHLVGGCGSWRGLVHVVGLLEEG